METRARYIVVGGFAVVVGLLALFLVLWVQGEGNLSKRRDVAVQFDGSAPGLRAGAAVTFNGLRVGDVTQVAFDPRNPNEVIARISIDAAVPVSSTTQVSLEAQGLMGSVILALSGGSSDKPLRTAPGESIPRLTAPAATSLTHEAQKSLRTIQDLVADNAGPLHDLITNLQTFSAVLANNSDRVDKILAGLEQMTGGSEKPKPVPTFDLATPDLHDLHVSKTEAQLLINDPSSVVTFDTQRFLTSNGDGQLTPATTQWTDTIPKLVLKKLVQAFASAQYKFASPPTDGFTPDYQLQIDVQKFQIQEGSPNQAEIRLGLRLMRQDGKILDTHVVAASAPATGVDGAPAAKAMTQAFAAVSRDIIVWYADIVAHAQKEAN
jgi:phospholipid/cholesterol/gamma-HCH transport system substrate-binding protein